MEPEALDSGRGLNSGTEDKAIDVGTTNFDTAALWAAVAFSMVSIEVLVFGSFLITDGSPVKHNKTVKISHTFPFIIIVKKIYSYNKSRYVEIAHHALLLPRITMDL